jgi:hypothetical protein
VQGDVWVPYFEEAPHLVSWKENLFERIVARCLAGCRRKGVQWLEKTVDDDGPTALHIRPEQDLGQTERAADL